VYDLHDTIAHTAQYNLVPDALGTELDFIERAESLLSARANAIRAEAEARISAGAIVPGWVMKSGRGQRVWAHPPEMLRMLLGTDITVTKLRTPADVEREGVTIPDALTKRPTTKPKLARMTPGDVERLFSKKGS
jgi:hypothetical protein